MAGAHRLSRLRGLRGLGQDPYFDPTTGNDVFDPNSLMPAPSDISISPTPTLFPSGGGLPVGYSPTSILSQAISTAGQIGAQALKPNPTITYGPGGIITASGGATLPASITASTSLAGLFSSPYLLLGILGLGAVVLLSRR